MTEEYNKLFDALDPIALNTHWDLLQETESDLKEIIREEFTYVSEALELLKKAAACREHMDREIDRRVAAMEEELCELCELHKGE